MIILDIREEDEITEMRIQPVNDDLQVLYIPSRMIFGNVDFLLRMAKTNKIWIMCKSSRRAQKVKDMYFKDVDSIKVIKGGILQISDENDINKELYKIIYGNRTLSIQQIMQIIFIILLIGLCFVYWFYNKYYLMVAGVIIGIVLLQVIMRFCLLGMIIPWKKYTN